ncbi:hypothetical protein NDU88_008607 [Pleurodeles waltl]|uniref:Uncharacterized protein n=1 Tax=Pleurodeles waltl TaxID=8319 RepID=A0AAV7QV64_PLEWA|nr:hypothetical protein NDU88_008607 [Pleurodeles waltl]
MRVLEIKPDEALAVSQRKAGSHDAGWWEEVAWSLGQEIRFSARFDFRGTGGATESITPISGEVAPCARDTFGNIINKRRANPYSLAWGMSSREEA